jgi:hypothetical protein
MDDGVVARAKSVLNPFVSNRVDSAWDPDSVDVEAINRTAFEHCGQTIDLVRGTGRSRGLLLAGEPGSGKTHLLQRLRRHIQRGNRDCFVYVPPVGGPERFFRDLLQHAVHDFIGNPAGSSSSQLESLLVRALLPAEVRERVTAAAFWTDVRKRYPPGQALFTWLEGPMQKLCLQLQLDPQVIRVLQHYLGEHCRLDAYAWLLGRSVPEAALERLGVSNTLEEDADALEALVTLSRLAGMHCVLVLAFDQLESLQIDAQDLQGLKAFATGLSTLFVKCRNVAAITCVQNYFKRDLERAVSHAHMQRLAQDQGALTLLDRNAAIQLVIERLAAVSELRATREALGESDPLWPLRPLDLEHAITPASIPARQLLDHCRDRFEQWRRGEVSSAPPSESLDEIWEARLERAAARPHDEGVLADGLLKLIDARTPGKAKRGTIRDVDLTITSQDGEIGIAICHTGNMTGLAGRLRRLRTVADSGRFKRLVIVRDERLRISPTAPATREHLEKLQQAGHVLLRPSAEAYAAIAAARQLFADAAAGDLSLNGKSVAPEDLKAWLAGNLSGAAADLLRALDAAEGTQSDDMVERVQALLEGQWVAPATDVAARMGLQPSVLLDQLATQQRTVGVLLGPPAVLFLRPEGLNRE